MFQRNVNPDFLELSKFSFGILLSHNVERVSTGLALLTISTNKLAISLGLLLSSHNAKKISTGLAFVNRFSANK